MYSGIDVLFRAVISVLSLSLQIAEFCLNVAVITGEALFNLFVFFITKWVTIVKSLSICAQIMYEDLYYFLDDLHFSISSLISVLNLIFEYLKFSFISFIYFILNVLAEIVNSINLAFISFYSSICQCVKFLELLRDSLLLIGSSIWLIFTYAIPVGFLHIVEFVSYLGNLSIHKLYYFINSSLVYIKHIYLNSKCPYESIFGLIIGILFLYVIVKYFTQILKLCKYLIRTVINPLICLVTDSSTQIWNICFRNSSNQSLFPNFFGTDFVVHRLQRTVNIINYYQPTKRKLNNDNRNLIKNKGDFEDLCIICLDNKRNMLILPCRHFCLCFTCSTRFFYDHDNCPICRQEIVDTVKVYY